MNQTLKRQLGGLAPKPGIYQFFNAEDKLLYVGKAKSLRSRIRSYFQSGAELSPAKHTMVKSIHHLLTTEVSNETEALLLERNLIKQHQPPYNIDLKDDKSWLYVSIDYREAYPRVTLERRPDTKGTRLFGPFVSAGSIRDSFRLCQKLFGLRACSNPPDRPCFLANLGRCLGHDLGPNSQVRYHSNLKFFTQLINGKIGPVIKHLERDMRQAAEARQFERAAKLRDNLKALERLRVRQNIVGRRSENFDIFGIAQGLQEACVVKLPIRSGALLDAERFIVSRTQGLAQNEILLEFIEQYYAASPETPKFAYVPQGLTANLVGTSRLLNPQRGKKRQLLKLAEQTAASHLNQSLAAWKRKATRAKLGLTELKTLLNLPRLPDRIEGYDISNLQGKQAVGSMVVLRHGLPDPKSYRKFTIQGLETPNDVAMLAQVITRRFTKNTDWPAPDLVMLDGGAGQLSAVRQALQLINVSVNLVALAKREELLYVPGRTEPIRLPPDAPARLILEELRNEAHRFGITFYRSRHRRGAVKSVWDELPKIGPKRKRLLKARFGSVTKLRQASIEELAESLGASLAKLIKQYLITH